LDLRLGAEFIACAGLALVVGWYLHRQQIQNVLPGVALAVIALISILFLDAQLRSTSRTTYPFVVWSMYSDPAPEPTVIRYRFTASPADTVDAPIAQWYPGPSPRAFLSRLDQVADRASAGNAMATHVIEQVLREVMPASIPERTKFIVERCDVTGMVSGSARRPECAPILEGSLWP
jgi:hypothetical protein